MPKEISVEEAETLGVRTIHHKMENGERRFRLVSADGSSYIRTEASRHSGWQNSHYHKEVTEWYVVQKDWFPSPELDKLTKWMTAEDIAQRRGNNPVRR
ncbi:hypothetical protein [Gorillibacterium timonense]|uniref:hypothetical protein n=1 Tax=Gorillibacterium timonense TaxID=1689269 RepID=UPI00071CFC47|nr:hypothetical protein [Gorillibacterium timonense]